MPKKKIRHEIWFGIPEGRLGKQDARFEIKRGKKTVGTLLVSQGAIEWVPASAKKYQYLLEWRKFSRLMREHGRRREKPGP